MWKLDTTRTDFIDLVPRLLSLENLDVKEMRSFAKKEPLKKDICLVWSNELKSDCAFPSYVVVNNGEKLDFLAWINTYAPSLRPITGKTHVLEQHGFLNFLDRKPLDKEPFLGAAIGLTLSEAIVSSRPSTRQSSPSYRECLATLSFALSNAVFSGVSTDDFAYVAASWKHAQKNSSRFNPDIERLNMLLQPWGVLVDLYNGTPTSNAKQSDLWSDEESIYDIVLELLKNGVVSDKSLNSLVNELSIPSDLAILAFEGNRESRIVAFEELLRLLENPKRKGKSITDFFIGYILNQLEPGTLDYVSLAYPGFAHGVTPLLWYGMIAGLSPKSSVFNYASGMGWDLAIELSRNDQTDSPSCDLDLSEFEMLLNSERAMGFSKSKRHGSYIVELLPSVNTVVAFKSEQENIGGQNEIENSLANLAGIEEAIHEMNNAMKKLNYAKASLEKDISKNRNKTVHSKKDNYSYGYRKR